jgi:transposase-like protein
MAKPDPRKQDALRRQGTLNPHPDAVTSPLFHDGDFFDPRDLLQVKYEMVRQVETENAPVSQAAREFGFSRPSFYHAQTAFQQGGLPGLLPQKRGPRQAHKLTPEVIEWIQQTRAAEPALGWPEVSRRIRERFGIQVHPRSVARGWARQQKKR